MMNAIDNLSAQIPLPAGAAAAGSAARRHDFESLLAGKRGDASRNDSTALEKRRDEAREAADGMISVTFLTPMMKMMRDDPFKSEMFHGGRGEEIFGAKLDEVLADRVAKSLRLPLADAVYRGILGQAAEGGVVNTHG